jgi:hypothetical protein
MLAVIMVPITNDVSNKDMSVTEVIKIMLPNTMGWEGKVTDTEKHETPNSSNKEGWDIVTTKDGQKSIPTGWNNPLSEKIVMWNVTATEVNLDIENVSQAGHYDIFNIVDQDEITLTLAHHKMYFKVANVGTGVSGEFINMQELQVMTCNKAINEPDGERWKAEVENEYQQMVKCKVFKTCSKN